MHFQLLVNAQKGASKIKMAVWQTRSTIGMAEVRGHCGKALLKLL
jgi:hypothetical protein